MYSFILIPASKRDEINAIYEDHGYGPDNFSIPVREKGTNSPITHYTCSWEKAPTVLEAENLTGFKRQDDGLLDEFLDAEGLERKLNEEI